MKKKAYYTCDKCKKLIGSGSLAESVTVLIPYWSFANLIFRSVERHFCSIPCLVAYYTPNKKEEEEE